MKTYLLFKKDKLVTVIQTKDSVYVGTNVLLGKMAILGFDRVVDDPQDAEKQIADWKARE